MIAPRATFLRVKPKALVLSIVLAISSTAAAAPWPGFLRLHAETRGFSLGRPTRVRPTPDGKAVLFLRSLPRSPVNSLYETELAGGKTRELVTPAQLFTGSDEQLSPEERARRERMRVSTKGFASFELSRDGTLLLLPLSGRLYGVRRADGKVTELVGSGPAVIDPHLSPDGKRVAYVRDRDLYVLDLATRKETRLTRSPHPRVSNGLAEFVAEEELERFRGFWWSPDGTRLAYEEADSRPVETFHLVDVTHPENEAEATPYPRPGMANARVRLGVIARTGGKTTWLKWDAERLPYLAAVEWEEAKAPLTLVVLSRLQKDLEVLAADDRSGATTRLLAEHDDAWLNLDPSVPRWLPDGSAFLWSSERDSSWALELRDRAGKTLRTLVAPEAGYRALLDCDGTHAWVTASREPTEQQVYRVALDGGALEVVTRTQGLHDAVFSRDHSVYALSETTATELPRWTAHATDDNRELAVLPSVAEQPPFRGGLELVTVGSDRFRAAVTRPRDFVRGKKYPVLVDVYGGPHHQQVARAQSTVLLRQWMADHGYLVIAVDGRGTPNRGRAWERAIAGSFGVVPLQDQVAGLKALAAMLPEIDLARVGIVGWSFGGYLAGLATLSRPDVFAAGVAGAPVVDWRDYDTAYTERYLGLPSENAAGYEASSLLTYAGKLERPLLIVHGTRDDNVYFFHSLKLSDALFRAGKVFELLPLPGLTHMVPDPSVKEALYNRIMMHFAAALRP